MQKPQPALHLYQSSRLKRLTQIFRPFSLTLWLATPIIALPFFLHSIRPLPGQLRRWMRGLNLFCLLVLLVTYSDAVVTYQVHLQSLSAQLIPPPSQVLTDLLPAFASFHDFLAKLGSKEAILAGEQSAAGWIGTPNYAFVFPRVAKALRTGTGGA